MRPPPDLPDGAVATALRGGFGVEAAALVPLAAGNDADSWSFRVETADGPAWFLKVRAGASPGRGERPSRPCSGATGCRTSWPRWPPRPAPPR